MRVVRGGETVSQTIYSFIEHDLETKKFLCPLQKVQKKWWGFEDNWLEVYLKNQPENIDYNSGVDMKETINVKELFLAHK